MNRQNINSLILIGVVIITTLIIAIQYWGQPARPAIPDLIIVGTTADYPPFSFYQNDTIVGLDIDIAQEAIKRMGKQSAIKNVPFELLIPQTKIGEVQVIAAGFSITPERSKELLFTQPYYLNNPLVIISRASEEAIISLHDLTDKKVAVNAGYSADATLSKLSHLVLERVPSISDALQALVQKHVDACVVSSANIKPILKEYGADQFKLFVVEETDETAALAISKMYPQLAEELKKHLQQMQVDGTLDQLRQKWNL